MQSISKSGKPALNLHNIYLSLQSTHTNCPCILLVDAITQDYFLFRNLQFDTLSTHVHSGCPFSERLVLLEFSVSIQSVGTRSNAYYSVGFGRVSGLFRNGCMTPVCTRVWYTAKQFLASLIHRGIWQCEQRDSVNTSQPLFVRFLRTLQKMQRFFLLLGLGSTLCNSAS